MPAAEDTSSLESQRIHIEYCASLRQLAEAMQGYGFLREAEEELKKISNSLVEPFSLAVFGRMKTGKSSVINSIIGKQLAITGVNEATATINRLCYAQGDAINQFTVHWKDAAPEQFPLDHLQKDWTGTNPEVLERIARAAYLELYDDTPTLKGIQVIDTPGTGSVAEAHEDVAKQFIEGQATDALVYVFPPVGRETDESALSSFRKGCLPASSPDNSVAILHKWDHILWDNKGDRDDIRKKAQGLYEHMKSLVATVIPFSAPLAYLSKCAKDTFWLECLEIISCFEQESLLERQLSRDDKWGRQEKQAALYQQAKELSLPWASFQILLRHLYREKPSDVASARACVRDLSGIEELELLLDKQFFRRAAIIQQRQTRARAESVLNKAYNLIDQHLKEQDAELRMLRLLEQSVQQDSLKRWVERKAYSLKDQRDTLYQQWLSIDKLLTHKRETMKLNDASVELFNWVKSDECSMQDAQCSLFLSILGHVSGVSPLSTPATMEQLSSLLRDISLLGVSPHHAVRDKVESIQTILFQYINNLTKT